MDKNYDLSDEHVFTMGELLEKLNNVINKTLGEVDCKHVFERAINNPKITGIAGDVIEQSVLGYKPNSDQKPDIIVDGVPMEVKTTGIRYSKKKGKQNLYEAKEPMSITAVSPEKIVNEEFKGSHFWQKLAHMLLIYYLYDSEITVEAKDYAEFYLKSYQFHEFSEDDKVRLQNDWEIVRDFIKNIQKSYKNPENEYPRLSSELRGKLMYIDTAPKWPNRPRFRLKRDVVTGIVQNHFESLNKLEVLPDEYNSFCDLDKKCHELTMLYRGLTIEQLIKNFNIKGKNIDKLDKSISEKIIIKMFGGESAKLNNVELFKKTGIIAKTIVVSSKNSRTEDTKLFSIDFDEILDSNMIFENSMFYDYFANHQFLCIMFEEKDEKQRFKENKFIGFKRLSFSDNFIESEVKRTWLDIRSIILNGKLKEYEIYDKKGNKRINKTGVAAKGINFPKAKDYEVFVRGSGEDSNNKPFNLCGIDMYFMYVLFPCRKGNRQKK